MSMYRFDQIRQLGASKLSYSEIGRELGIDCSPASAACLVIVVLFEKSAAYRVLRGDLERQNICSNIASTTSVTATWVARRHLFSRDLDKVFRRATAHTFRPLKCRATGTAFGTPAMAGAALCLIQALAAPAIGDGNRTAQNRRNVELGTWPKSLF